MTSPQPNAFPPAGIDAFLSHFVIAIRINVGDRSGILQVCSLPAAVQTVVRTSAFRPSEQGERSVFPMPDGSSLAAEISRGDFLVSPDGFFDPDQEQVWLQILNLDASGDTPLGPLRVILGETFRREYPDLYEPSFGAAQSLRDGGFPARLFFSPNAVVETPFGAWKTRPKALVGAQIDSFPPVGSYPSLVEPVPLDSVESLRTLADKRAVGELEPVATIVALAHPIDAVVFDANEAFASIQRSLS